MVQGTDTRMMASYNANPAGEEMHVRLQATMLFSAPSYLFGRRCSRSMPRIFSHRGFDASEALYEVTSQRSLRDLLDGTDQAGRDFHPVERRSRGVGRHVSPTHNRVVLGEGFEVPRARLVGCDVKRLPRG